MNDCRCGHVDDEHESGFFRKCLVPRCYCLDFEPKKFEAATTSKHPTKPCGECPFRREAPAGWIGGHSKPDEITAIVMADQKFPCHAAVNRLENDGADFETAVDAAPYCVGSIAMMNNTCKLSHNSFVVDLQKRVGRRGDVFSNAREFIEHHNTGPTRKRRQSR